MRRAWRGVGKEKREERWKEEIEIEAKDMKKERGFGRKDETYSKTEWPAHDYTDAPRLAGSWGRDGKRKPKARQETK
jgi:hypothetical protein